MPQAPQNKPRLPKKGTFCNTCRNPDWHFSADFLGQRSLLRRFCT